MRAAVWGRVCLTIGIFVSLATSVAGADPIAVEISKLHLCCGGCQEALSEALETADGVRDLIVERKKQKATFTVDSASELKMATQAMAAAGFFGVVMANGEAYKIEIETLEDELADRVTFEKVHLCCGGCARAIVRAFADYEPVVAVDCNTDEGTVTLTGKELKVASLRDVLNKAGYHGRLKR